TVFKTVSMSRGLFGMKRDPERIEQILKALTLWDKKDNTILTLSGGMKRRVMIAKALAHEPDILFLDEPTAGVDVELRQDMWRLVEELRQSGVTIILTTHYIEEAEEIADRIGVINKGELILVEEKTALMSKLGQKRLVLELAEPLSEIPKALSHFDLSLEAEGCRLVYSYDTQGVRKDITRLLRELADERIRYTDLSTEQSSLEDIFVNLVRAA
ncbi:MAG: ABC transporter ATP-binding protein, partial [Pseudomonadota bacterium]